jgi:hypothetical protein
MAITPTAECVLWVPLGYSKRYYDEVDLPAEEKDFLKGLREIFTSEFAYVQFHTMRCGDCVELEIISGFAKSAEDSKNDVWRVGGRYAEMSSAPAARVADVMRLPGGRRVSVIGINDKGQVGLKFSRGPDESTPRLV